jgi:hypothetical protein
MWAKCVRRRCPFAYYGDGRFANVTALIAGIGAASRFARASLRDLPALWIEPAGASLLESGWLRACSLRNRNTRRDRNSGTSADAPRYHPS